MAIYLDYYNFQEGEIPVEGTPEEKVFVVYDRNAVGWLAVWDETRQYFVSEDNHRIVLDDATWWFPLPHERGLQCNYGKSI